MSQRPYQTFRPDYLYQSRYHRRFVQGTTDKHRDTVKEIMNNDKVRRIQKHGVNNATSEIVLDSATILPGQTASAVHAPAELVGDN